MHFEISEFLSLPDTVGDALLKTNSPQNAFPGFLEKGQIFAPYPLLVRNGFSIFLAGPEILIP
jgi:hypothetical protein